jgi:hypothetical protein
LDAECSPQLSDPPVDVSVNLARQAAATVADGRVGRVRLSELVSVSVLFGYDLNVLDDDLNDLVRYIAVLSTCP